MGLFDLTRRAAKSASKPDSGDGATTPGGGGPRGDRDSARWWAALDHRQLLVQECTQCRWLRWPPRAYCGRCGSWDSEWIPLSGRGTILSWTVTHRAPAGVPTPYVVVLVQIDEQDDICIPGFCDGEPDGSDMAIGAPVAVGFDTDATDITGQTVIRWRRI